MDIFGSTDELKKIIEQSSHSVETSLLFLEKFQEWLNRHKYLLSSNIVLPIVPLLKKKIIRTELEDRVLKSLSENEGKKQEKKKEKQKKFSEGEETLFNALLKLYLSKSVHENKECLECVADKIRYINCLQSCKKPVLPPALFQLANHLKKVHVKSERLFFDQKREICKQLDADQFKNSVASVGMRLEDEDMLDILALVDTGYKNIISLEKFKQALKQIEKEEETLQILDTSQSEKHELQDTDEKKDVKKHKAEPVIQCSLLQVTNKTSFFSREQSLSEADITERKLTRYPVACGHCCKIFRKYVPEPPVVHKEECIGILEALWLLWNRNSARHCSLKKFEFMLRNMPGPTGEKPACRCPCHQIGLESVTLPMTNAEFLEYKRGEYRAEMEKKKAAHRKRKKQNKRKKEEILPMSKSQHSELIEVVEPEYEYYLGDKSKEQHKVLTDFVKTWLAYKTSEQDDIDATYSAYPAKYSHYFQNDVFHRKHIANRYYLDPFEEVKGMTRSQWENISQRQELTTDAPKPDTSALVRLLEEIEGTHFTDQELSSIPQTSAQQTKEVKTQEHTKTRRRCMMESNLFQSTFTFSVKFPKPHSIASIQTKQKEEEKKEIKFIKNTRKDKMKGRRKEEINFIKNKSEDKIKRRRERKEKEIKFIKNKQRKRRLPIYCSGMDVDLENRRFPEIDHEPEVREAGAIFGYIPYYWH